MPAALELYDRVLHKLRGEGFQEEHQQRLDAWFAKQPQSGQVGAFEGAGYCTSGVFRSQLDCIMFSKGLKDFCAACGAGIREVLEASTDHPATTEK